ncbi:MAG: cob(I)yrinic acid a,c-diamide adenosyltransferase [Firmicutes bacterium]|nr:cob(I)yrinic acid a,c-diamide adenosyltransferase [Bacillota bacterium]
MAKAAGLVLVYTGNGKGKTTAALGLALRALGHGQRVFMVQFLKGDPCYGEIQAINKYLPTFEVVQSGKNKMRPDGSLVEDRPDVVREGFSKGKEALLSGAYDLVIFDEINIVLDRGRLTVQEVLETLAARPKHVNVVLTGRHAAKEIIDFADLVSEVQEIKHPFRRGVRAQQGVEF